MADLAAFYAAQKPSRAAGTGAGAWSAAIGSSPSATASA